MTNGKSFEALIQLGQARLSAMPAYDDDTLLECLELLQLVSGYDRHKISMNKHEMLSPCDCDAFSALLARREQGEPLQYIIGEWDFYGLVFKVGTGVLIPRPETEMIVDLALDYLQKHSLDGVNILDLCSGSGCIPIAIAKHLPQVDVYGVELYDQAFSYFQTNGKYHNLANLHTIQGDALNPPTTVTHKKYHVITSNPPYIQSDEVPLLQEEVLSEPVSALDGGMDGLDFYRVLPRIAENLLVSGGLLIMEIGNTQGESVSTCLKSYDFTSVTVLKDLSNNDRVVIGYRI